MTTNQEKKYNNTDSHPFITYTTFNFYFSAKDESINISLINKMSDKMAHRTPKIPSEDALYQKGIDILYNMLTNFTHEEEKIPDRIVNYSDNSLHITLSFNETLE